MSPLCPACQHPLQQETEHTAAGQVLVRLYCPWAVRCPSPAAANYGAVGTSVEHAFTLLEHALTEEADRCEYELAA